MSDETELLNALFAAAMSLDCEGDAERDALWRGFLQRLASISQADSAALHVVWSAAPASGWQVGADWPAPQASTVERMRSDRVYSQIDLPAPVAPARPLRALKWRLGAEGVGLLVLHRDGSDFRALSAVQLTNLIPHLRLALTGWRQLDRHRAEAALDQQLARDLGTGWVLFSPSGQIKRMAPGMAEVLSEVLGATARRDLHGSIQQVALDDNTEHALRQALAAAALREGIPQFVTLSSTPLVQMTLTAQHLVGIPFLIGRLRHAPPARDLPLEHLVSRFDLSRSEARLAAYLCDGFSLQETAQELNWTRETARSYAKKLYAKLGVTGQTGVIRRILLDTVWLRRNL